MTQVEKFHASGCIFSHSSRIDWKRTVERYRSPKLGNTTWNHATYLVSRFDHLKKEIDCNFIFWLNLGCDIKYFFSVFMDNELWFCPSNDLFLNYSTNPSNSCPFAFFLVLFVSHLSYLLHQLDIRAPNSIFAYASSFSVSEI